mgnify:CR=1 FL=1
MNRKSLDWIETYSGIKFFPLAPKIEDINIVDIAHALSNICRFNGHSSYFYSVAQHSVLVSLIAEKDNYSREIQLQCLLHDAAECYFADISSPVKKSIKNKIHPIETKLESIIAKKYGVLYPFSDKVKEMDLKALATEARFLEFKHIEDWKIIKNITPVLDLDFECLYPEDSKKLFLYHFYKLIEGK